MFGIGWPELLLIGIVAAIVIGPKDLPPLLRRAGRLARQGRILWDDLRAQFDIWDEKERLADMEREAGKLQKEGYARHMPEGDAEPPLEDDAPEKDTPENGEKRE